jgi:3',5'-cyclic AMP phosphodiesterase CpdA
LVALFLFSPSLCEYLPRTYGDLRIICLDSAFEHGVDGYISPDQTKWLEEELSVPYGRGTIVLSYHPLISEAAGVSAKVNRDCERTVKNSDIIGFFNGHIHTSCYSFYLNKPHITAESIVHLATSIRTDECYLMLTPPSLGKCATG